MSISTVTKSLLFRAVTGVILVANIISFRAQSAPLGSPNAQVGGTFYTNLDMEPSGLNPLRGSDAYTTSVVGYIFDTLLNTNIDTYAKEPALAESYEVSKDGKVITFILREGATFHDGKPVTAEDVKFSFDVFFDDKLSDADKRVHYENIDRVEIADARTIRFHVKNKYFRNLTMIGAGMEILPKHIYGDSSKKVSKIAIGSGAYMLEKYDQGQKITLKRNPNWWGFKTEHLKGFANFERIVFRFIKDRTAQLESMKKGDLSYLGLMPEQYIKQTEGAPWGTKILKEQVENSSPKGTSFVAFNIKRPLFADRNVRHALSQLFNRDFIIDKFLYGKAVAAAGPWYQQNPAADPNAKPVKFDVAAAKEKLKKAGWSDSNKDGVLDKKEGDKLVDFKFTIIHPGSVWEKYLSVFQEELKKAGIIAELKQLEWNAFQKALDGRNFDMVALAWTAAVEEDPKQIWHSTSFAGQGSNFVGYANADVDKWIDEARLELNDEKRYKILRKVYTAIANDHPYIFVTNPRYGFYAYTSKISRVKPTFKYAIGIDTWWFAE